MANVLPVAKCVVVVAHLVEGAGIRPTSRLTDVSQPAILSLLLKMGDGCERLHNRLVRDVDFRTVQVDEIWRSRAVAGGGKRSRNPAGSRPLVSP